MIGKKNIPISVLLGSLLLSPFPTLFAQPTLPTACTLDVLCFKSPQLALGHRADIYVSIPYTALEFLEAEKMFVARYSTQVIIRDPAGKKIIDSTYTESVIENDEAVVKGATGKADNTIHRYLLKPGTYKAEIIVSDKNAKREVTSTKQFVLPNYDTTSEAMSSLMYVTDVEQRGSRYSITPFIGDVIWNTEQPLFVFLEAYLDSVPAAIAFSYTVISKDGKGLLAGTSDILPCSTRATQTFFRVSGGSSRPIVGTYTLTAKMHPVKNSVVDTTVTLATQSRQYIIPRSIFGDVLSDLTKAIKQLQYVADQADISHINAGASEPEKQARFETYWKSVDPTPQTMRNEAFEDYYARIETANKRYKSYNEGWLTDMGRVYIIFGEPLNVERFQSQTGAQIVTRWTYRNNFIVTFEDNTGFGDFRLRSPLPPGSKYTYRR